MAEQEKSTNYSYDLNADGADQALIGMVLKEGVYRPGEDQHFVPSGSPITLQLLQRLRQEKGVERVEAWSPQEQALSESMSRTQKLMTQARERSMGIVQHELNMRGTDIDHPEAVRSAIRTLKSRAAFTFLNELLGDLDSMVARILKDLNVETIEGIKRLRNHHESTGNHSIETGLRGMAIARSMGETDAIVHQVGLAGFVHDLGKLFIPLSILDKQGPLTNDEFAHMKHHAALGAEFLAEQGRISKPFSFAAGSHHETFTLQGGYGILTTDAERTDITLRGDDRQLAWRISNYLAISDVWTALGEPRAYHKVGKFEVEILLIIVDMMKQGKFHPQLFKEGFYALFHQRPEAQNMLHTGTHFPLFSFPRPLQEELKQRFNLPPLEWKLSVEELERLGLTKKVVRSGLDEELLQRHRGVTLHELRARRIFGVPDDLEREGIKPKRVDYRIAFLKDEGDFRVQAMLLKIDDTPLGLKARIASKQGVSLDAIQAYLFQKVGLFELDLAPYLQCPDDDFLKQVATGFR
ncbi:HD-GYP domain-containing protein [Magnetofaba australis]|uniref:Putative metal dependent phosphohydrolase n=1 Tax=Magnetofaba australis IT-1 TaxID=1434232 RepID=A0A1Y2K2S4_9PROT|nr:HD domain-containing protein [Magnetofaba australis]OSM02338.1 putative metal dependent phosphohydrolase [Magnetofaba australis IT-1]